MTHTYNLTGMTCDGCEAKVKFKLLTQDGVTAVDVSRETNTATITMDKHIALSTLQDAIGGNDSKYQIGTLTHNETAEQAKDWFVTYKPILLIFAYLLGVTVLTSFYQSQFNWMLAMSVFMAGFFLVFSFFKLLNLKAFAESYAMYDIVAMKFNSWGYIYAFLELSLGVAYIVAPESLLVNVVAFVLMSVSILGVLKSVLNKQKIQCACLGAVFNLPMSTVTIIEDALMIVMSGVMIASLIG